MNDMRPERSLAHAFANQAKSNPKRLAMCDHTGRSWTYSALATEVGSLAAELMRRGVEMDSTVAVVGGRAAETVVGMLGALAAGGAYCVIDPKVPPMRRDSIIESLAPKAVVVAGRNNESFAGVEDRLVLWSEELPRPTMEVPYNSANQNALAYVLFTSGSTARPKGVMVENKAVLNMLESYERLAPSANGFAGSLIAPTGFDVSAWEIFSVLLYGGTLYIPDDACLSGGEELWEFFCESKIESAYIPPGLVAPVALAAKQGGGNLKRVLVGVEPIPQGVLKRLGDACHGLRIVNGYGPTETTISATLHLFTKVTDSGRRTPIGLPVAKSRVDVVDEELSSVPKGKIGEIIVFGNCLARGYLDGERGGFTTVGGERAYRTGDLGRFLDDGALEFVGRVDRQLKINGFRVELDEVEAALTAMPGVRRGVALVLNNENVNRLVAVVAASQDVSKASVREYLGQRLPEYAMPSRIIVMSELPLTANGKVDADAVLTSDSQRPWDATPYAPPRSAWESEILKAFSKVLGIDKVGIDDNFYELGGNSLDAVRIAAHLYERGYAIRASFILAAPVIRQLKEPKKHIAPITVVAPGTYPANRAQEGLWAWRELNPQASNTTVVHAVEMKGSVDPERIAQAMSAVARRHEALRTTFEIRPDGGLQQRLASFSACELPVIKVDSRTAVDAEIRKWLAYRFDIQSQSWAVRLLRSEEFSVLIFAADHIVFDGESANLFQRDLACAYDNLNHHRDPPPGPASLSSYSVPDASRMGNLREWWRNNLEHFTERAALPEPMTLGSGSFDCQLTRLVTHVDKVIWENVLHIARSAKVSAFVVVLAALKSFLRQRDGESDNTVAIAKSLRDTLEMTTAIGNFVNLIPIRDYLPKREWVNVSFRDYLDQLSNHFSRVIEHADLPFEDMIAGISGSSNPNVAAPARIVLAQQSYVETSTSKDGIIFTPWANIPSNAIYDLSIFLFESTDRRSVKIEWVWRDKGVLDGTMPWMIQGFWGFLRSAVAEPEQMLSSLPVLAQEETALIFQLAEPRETDSSTTSETLISLFDAQVVRQPEAVAIQEGETLVTYAQLSQRVVEICRNCPASGQGFPVIIVLDKSVDLIAAMLAALKAGSPYLPIAPDHACTRLPDFALGSEARVCITTEFWANELQLPNECHIILVDALPAIKVDGPAEVSHVEPNDLAYIMPTSGSSGPPKLVGVPHRAVVRLVHKNASLPLDEFDRTMLISSVSFDAATFEIWGPLANGGQVVIPSPTELLDPILLCSAIKRNGVTAGFFTKTLFEHLLDGFELLAGMRHIIVGGETVPPSLFARASRIIAREALVNGYGPTENTTFSCCFRLDRDPSTIRSVPIGTPISGSGAIIVDESLRPVPPGKPGEILVTGEGLAAGYINDANLTRSRFVTVPALNGTRAYRTGDLGRLLPEGQFEYLGRIDRQLKINGFRVEPGEVEAALYKHPAIRQCVAYAEDYSGVRLLVAAVEADGVTDSALRTWLSEKLPAYLIPIRVRVVDRFPMTANGKLDMLALRSQAPLSVCSASEGQSSDMECLVGEIAAALLGLPNVELDDDLFDMGANSMIALALAARLSEKVGCHVPGHSIYAARTVRTLAARLETNARLSSSDNKAVQRIKDRAFRIRKGSRFES